jgi:transcription termination factor Rho
MNPKQKENRQQQQHQHHQQQHHRKRNGGHHRRRGHRPGPPRDRQQAGPTEEKQVAGVVDILPSGVGFLRQIEQDLLPSKEDLFLPGSLLKEYNLRPGMLLKAFHRNNGHPGKAPAVNRVSEINGLPAEQYQVAVPFDRQISIDPLERFILTPAPSPSAERSMRFIELMTPIGKGQRALIVAPPRTGKTTLLHQLASSVSFHHPDVFLIVLLIDERPEEVTHFKRGVKGMVLASSSDKEAASHLRIARLTLELSRSLAESGKDVFLLLDSITRLGRASNREEGSGGKTLSGGVGSRALEFPRRFFGSARNLENGGSLTIIATALIDTGSRMDEVIFQEFKGTGNMELVLSRKLADSRIFPAVDLSQSGTRKEEKILPPTWLTATQKLRRHLSTLPPGDALEVLLERLEKAESTESFCASLA